MAPTPQPGQIGEVISRSIVLGPGVTLTTIVLGEPSPSVSLTAGDWDVQGEVWVTAGTGAPTIGAAEGSIRLVQRRCSGTPAWGLQGKQ